MRTSDQIIKDASNKESVEDYSLLELYLYLNIKQILKMYFNNQLSKEEANHYKQIAVKDYETKVKEYEYQQQMYQEHIKNIKETEILRTNLRKKLKDNEPVTETKLGETINICLEIISKTYKEPF